MNMEEKEPTILDYVKAKLMPWKGGQIKLPSKGEMDISPHSDSFYEGFIVEKDKRDLTSGETEREQQTYGEVVVTKIAVPWRSFFALILALFAQASISPPQRDIHRGAILFFLSALMILWSATRNEWSLPSLPEGERKVDSLTVRKNLLWIGVLVLPVAFLALRGNLFTSINFTLWMVSLLCMVFAFWVSETNWQVYFARFQDLLSQRKWKITIYPWTLLLLLALGVIFFFRFYRLGSVPPEMTSDHAEKLLDVSDVINGEYHIFFPRNAGREALQMYLDAFIASRLGTGLTFLTLKIGTSIIGLLALPFLYLLGKEVGNRNVGFWAMTFAGISYWHNVISRVGLRFPFYPLFTATTMYFLLRAIRNSNRNDWILAGLSLGLSFYGYTADRILPLLVITGVGLFFIHQQSMGRRHQTLWQLIILIVMSSVVFIPLLRYMIDEPSAFAYRTLTRMGTLERQYPGPVMEIFLSNLWRAWVMFFWEAGNVWLASIPYYPALGTVTGALYFLGSLLLMVRYLRKRHWIDLFILLSIPILMLPSIMALAFPIENPNLYRTGGAIVPVFLIIGLGIEGLIRTIKDNISHPWGVRLGWGLGFLLILGSAIQDYDWIFNRYYQQYRESAWNTTEVGRVIRAFADSVGSGDHAWVVPFPHWVDTRLVGINAGFPIKDYALWPEQLEESLGVPPPKLFILRPDDQVAIQKLRLLYPEGWFQVYTSKVPTKDFLIFFVPPKEK